jgi:radical SAM-linked protein
MRIALEFEKKGAAKYISHLDLQRAFSRAIRRCGLPIQFSHGFNPHYQVSFASALALGIESECEAAEIIAEDGLSPEVFLEAMKKALPPGLNAKSAAVLREDAPKLAAAVSEAEYKVCVKKGNIDEIKSAVYDIMNSERLCVSKNGKETDIRKMIKSLDLSGDTIVMRLEASPTGTLRPDVMAEEIKKRAGFACNIVRTGLFTTVNGELRSLLAAYKK